jgi:pSer/pThr/pTyr-binding forkhead associated (FHA) protein
VRRFTDLPQEEPTTVVHEMPLPASVRLATAKPFLLEQVAGPGAPRQFVLELDETIVGRSLQATISVDGNGMSRQHLTIKRAGPEFTFTDLNSSNGVFLNGVKTHSAVLRQGDTVQLGDVVFVFHEGS